MVYKPRFYPFRRMAENTIEKRVTAFSIFDLNRFWPRARGRERERPSLSSFHEAAVLFLPFVKCSPSLERMDFPRSIWNVRSRCGDITSLASYDMVGLLLAVHERPECLSSWSGTAFRSVHEAPALAPSVSILLDARNPQLPQIHECPLSASRHLLNQFERNKFVGPTSELVFCKHLKNGRWFLTPN